jgi:hypothetical protein
VLFQKGQLSRHPWYLLHEIAKNDGSGSLDLQSLQKRWVKHVLSIDDERTRSYAIRVADPRFLEEDIHAALQENAEAMTDPELRKVTLWHLGLDIQ